MNSLFVGLMWDYGRMENGRSNEYYNLFLPLQSVTGCDAHFDFAEVEHRVGREKMNQQLLELVKVRKPAFALIVPFKDHFIPEVVQEIGKHTLTVCYFFDDMWRIEYARRWAKLVHFVITSDINGVGKFRDAGFSNAIYAPFGVNHRVFPKLDLPKIYDVTFIGQYHPIRDWYISRLKKAGIEVRIWGSNWRNKASRIDQDGMIRIFNQSRINLNLSNCVSWDLRYLLHSPRAVKDTLDSVSKKDPKTIEQVKGRHFEINACGGFQLSYYVEGLETCYAIGKEIAIYSDPKDLIQKIRHYLSKPDEREAIAMAGYKRTLESHTMEQRFAELFQQLGLGAHVGINS